MAGGGKEAARLNYINDIHMVIRANFSGQNVTFETFETIETIFFICWK